MRGVYVHRDIYVSVAGTDLIRLEHGRFVVLEDNLRVPSGVSYMLANREATKRVLPGLFDRYHVSPVAHPTPLLDALAREIALDRGSAPLETLVRLTGEIFNRFEYNPQATQVDSPIDDALRARHGVCQDFAHIMIALVRPLGVPCRYVSGYLYRQPDRDVRSSDGATHAWVEALLPDVGWVGFDPTNNLMADDRHIRVAIGRDYADVPPTRGVFQGASAVHSELGVRHRRHGVGGRSRDHAAPALDVPRSDAGATDRRQPAAVARVDRSGCGARGRDLEREAFSRAFRLARDSRAPDSCESQAAEAPREWL
jgi:transglutaminase-like putative cysteine protease